ncbi:hypothetical protein AVEN_209963-1 [Araneus ventricosus]|uniref:RNase H type-1 domain-containing protein n=1 Tax=Araneus ventricosus TaxID=182803 RepID=A0A4Y2DEV6_ARAVE|nr:hypothetical protein AVEN_209963-1 [Araneus ventricosus]
MLPTNVPYGTDEDIVNDNTDYLSSVLKSSTNFDRNGRFIEEESRFLSVFRSELSAVDEGLDSLSAFSRSIEIWILTDSRSSIQHLANWHRVRDNTEMNILNKLKSLSVCYRIRLQWIPSHVNIQGNEIADALAKAGVDDASVLSAPLTYSQLFS